MDIFEQNLALLEEARVEQIPLARLLSRNGNVYSLKSMYFCWLLREAILWRVHELLSRSWALHTQGHVLAARILLRTALETVASLVHHNRAIKNVLNGSLTFPEFEVLTKAKLFGSKNAATPLTSTNIMTVFKSCEKSYPGLTGIYENLSECAHPSFEGLYRGYLNFDEEAHDTACGSRWSELYPREDTVGFDMCLLLFHYEYNEVWAEMMESLEGWVDAHFESLNSNL
jgi:hypothetical protein